MKLKSIKITPYTKKTESPLKAVVTLTYTNSLVLQGMRLVKQRSNPNKVDFVYPIQRNGRETRSFYYPATKDYRAELAGLVLGAYEEMPDKNNRFTKEFEVPDEVDPLVLGRVQVYPHRTFDTRALAKVHVTVEDEINLRFMELMKSQNDGALFLGIPYHETAEKYKIPYYKFMDENVRASLLAQVLPVYEIAQQELRRNRRRNPGPLTSKPFVSLQ